MRSPPGSSAVLMYYIGGGASGFPLNVFEWLVTRAVQSMLTYGTYVFWLYSTVCK